MDRRQMKGKLIAQQSVIRETKGGWTVRSQSKDHYYLVDEEFNCNCPDSQYHKTTCKHAFAVRYYLKTVVETQKGQIITEKPITYSQMWKEYTKAQTSEVNMFDKLLSDLVQNIEEPAQDRGRPRLSLSLFPLQKCRGQRADNASPLLQRHKQTP